MAKYGKGAGKMVEKEMKKMKQGGHKIKSRVQAIAIGLSEARSKGIKVPLRPKRKTARKAANPKRKKKK